MGDNPAVIILILKKKKTFSLSIIPNLAILATYTQFGKLDD
jgi:hypothetical protein